MKKLTIFVIVFLAAVCLIIAISYFFVEKPAEDRKMSYNNLSIAVTSNGDNIISNYTIMSYNAILAEGNTVKEGYSFQSIISNQSFTVYAESPGTYTSRVDYQPTDQSPIRIDIKADKIGTINLSHYGTFWQDDPILLNLNVSGLVKNPILCFRWSMNIINAEISELNIIDFDIPKRLNLDRCYYLNKTMSNELKSYSVYYSKFGDYSNDYLNIVIFDGDITSDSNGKVLYETDSGKDIFMPDVNYHIE